MKKVMLLLSLLSCPIVAAAQSDNPFVWQSGKLSLGVVSGDSLALYDIFKHVDGITARVGGSITLAQYDRFGAFAGAAAPTSDPSSVAMVGGPSMDLDDVAKAMIKSMLQVLPFKLDSTTMDNLASAARLKLYGGYDFRYQSIIAGAGFGLKLF
jgi:hypothetical protein